MCCVNRRRCGSWSYSGLCRFSRGIRPKVPAGAEAASSPFSCMTSPQNPWGHPHRKPYPRFNRPQASFLTPTFGNVSWKFQDEPERKHFISDGVLYYVFDEPFLQVSRRPRSGGTGIVQQFKASPKSVLRTPIDGGEHQGVLPHVCLSLFFGIDLNDGTVSQIIRSQITAG